MTAAHAHPRRDNVVALKSLDDWDLSAHEGHATVQQWSPETQFVGALMWLPADRARPILECVHDEDVEAPLTRWTLQLIRGLVDGGQDPNPVLVVRRAELGVAESCSGTGKVRRYHQLTLHVADVYHNVVGYDAGVLGYAREVLDDSYRRAIRAHGLRMQQMAEAMSDREDLTDYVTHVMRGDLRDIWTRTNALERLTDVSS